jgi:Tfp pilus assembly protein PilN
MTRLPRTGISGPARKLAAIHLQGGHYRIVLTEGRNGSIALVDARSIPKADLPTALAALLRDHKPDHIIRLAPGSQSVCRCAELPAGDDQSLAGALALLAEAELPESLPPHRRAAGLIPGEGASSARIALLTGWRDGPEGAPAPLSTISESWTTEAAALALLRGPSGVAVYADRAEGAIAIVAGGPRRIIARILVENGESHIAWASALRSAVRESCAAAGLERTPAPEAGETTLELPDSAGAALRSRVKNLREDPRWLAEYGIALGALLIATAHDPRTAALASMTASGHLSRPPAWERATIWLGNPRHAWTLAAACIALMLIGPLALAAARIAVLNAKSGALEQGRQERQQLARRAALYQQLDQLRWPMTKLMADIAGATPVGVVVDDLRLGNDVGVTFRGTAENLDQLYNFHKNLSDLRVFKDVKINRSEAAGSSVEFDIAADVASPHTPGKPAEDFAAKTLAARLYGEGASNTATPVVHRKTEEARARAPRNVEPAEPRPEGAQTSSTPAPAGAAREPRTEPTESSRRPATTTPDAMPAPLTDEQIAAMNFSKASVEWATRKGKLPKAPDEATKSRLESEIAKLRERADAAKVQEQKAREGGS